MEADCALERGLLFPEVGRDFRCEQEQINVTPRDVLPPARGTEEDDGLGRRGYVQSIKKADLLKPEKEIRFEEGTIQMVPAWKWLLEEHT